MSRAASSCSSNPFYLSWGLDATDIPVPADYDGDGITGAAFSHPSTGTFYLVQSSTGRGVAIAMPGCSPSQIPVLRRPQ